MSHVLIKLVCVKSMLILIKLNKGRGDELASAVDIAVKNEALVRI